MFEQEIALVAATICAGLGLYAVSLAFRRTEPGPISALAYGLFAANVGFSCWAILA
jgi:hypothetical protein